MEMQWLRDNWFIVLAILAIMGGWIEFRVSSQVQVETEGSQSLSQEEMDAIHSIDTIETRIDGVEQGIQETKAQHKSDSDRMDSKIERIVDILLED